MSGKHDSAIDLAVDSSHTRVIRLVGQGRRVLELGCATGRMGQLLTERFGCTVTGIEVDAEAAADARRVLARVITGDVETLDLQAALGDAGFDVIVCADVLEHLRAPARVLDALRRWLVPDGYVVASIPNVAHAAVIAELLTGRFRYRPLGLLDEGHVRFFTRDSIYETFETAGLEITHLERLTVEPQATELAASFTALAPSLEALVLAHEESRTYQFVLAARPAPSPAPRGPDAEPPRVQWPAHSPQPDEGRARVEGQLDAVLTRARYLESEREAQARELGVLSAQVQRLDGELARTRGEVVRLTHETNRLVQLLAVRDARVGVLEADIAAMRATMGWRALERARRVRARVRRMLGRSNGR